jgi:GTP diphosphokinase / guanosine-3',5'-bis(diphosphate) 3'-diphosphatase
MIALQTIERELLSHHPDADVNLVKRAYVFAARMHKGQLRKSGDPYIMHPMEVANIVAQHNLDAPSVCAGLLHDTVEDTEATIEDVRYQFGSEIASLVESLTKLNKINFQNRQEAQAANFRKMLIAMSKDLRVILIKLSDRLHNMRTLGKMPAEKKSRISRETMEIYSPLASRLGLYGIKVELEDLCFKYIYPEEYRQVADMIAQTKLEREDYIHRVMTQMEEYLDEYDIQAEVSGRPKHLWSIRQKLKRTGGGLETLYDVLAFRVLVPRPALCYEVLGHIHSLWRPIPGRFKDYIALPKQNGYQSLHTAVFGPDNERIEVQIRTENMHRSAELGVAAHWVYKEQGTSRKRRRQPMSPDETFVWLRQLLEWQRDLKDPNDFLQAVRVDLFEEEVYVFTPLGEVKPLPRGATPVDLAYSIHTDLGHECTGAKVNARIVPLKYELQNGDVVEIIRTRGSHPKHDWLKFVKTGRAETKIRTYLRSEANEQSYIAGHEVLEKALKSHKYSLSRLVKEGKLNEIIEYFKMSSERDLLISVGYGKIVPEKIIEFLFPTQTTETQSFEDIPTQEFNNTPSSSTNTHNSILVDGEDGLAIHYPKCCSPISGDEVVGFVTLGRGVTIHRSDCPHCYDYDPLRKVPVAWNQNRSQSRPVELRILSDDAQGLLASISQTFRKSSINISAVNCQTSDENSAINDFTIMVKDLGQLKDVITQLKQIRGVSEVIRITN